MLDLKLGFRQRAAHHGPSKRSSMKAKCAMGGFSRIWGLGCKTSFKQGFCRHSPSLLAFWVYLFNLCRCPRHSPSLLAFWGCICSVCAGVPR